MSLGKTANNSEELTQDDGNLQQNPEVELNLRQPNEQPNIPIPREEAAKRGSELVKQFKEQGIGQQAGRSGGHGEPYKRAGAELIRQANSLSKNDPLKEALKVEGNRLIQKGKSISHPRRR